MSRDSKDPILSLVNILKEQEKQLNYIEYKVDQIESTCTDIYKLLTKQPVLNKPLVHKQKNILVIDDNENIRTSYKLILEGEGYGVKVASTGLEALRILKLNNFDVVILDWNLPDMLGDELYEKLTNDHNISNIILVTGYSSIESVSSQGQKFLQKPLDPEELLNEVRKYSSDLPKRF